MRLRTRHYSSYKNRYTRGQLSFGWKLWHAWIGNRRKWALDLYFRGHTFVIWIDGKDE